MEAGKIREGDTARSGHPLPDSEEARHDEIPESLERSKGQGDDARDATQATPIAVTPEGKPYRSGEGQADGDLAEDQAAHQDGGQSLVPDA